MLAIAGRKTESTMRSRNAATGANGDRRLCDELKDEVYRQMFRVEEGRTGADKELAVALLRAWMVLEVGPRSNTSRKWLRSICPICVELIQSSGNSSRACKGRESCA
jgi:hypothetical protein